MDNFEEEPRTTTLSWMSINRNVIDLVCTILGMHVSHTSVIRKNQLILWVIKHQARVLDEKGRRYRGWRVERFVVRRPRLSRLWLGADHWTFLFRPPKEKNPLLGFELVSPQSVFVSFASICQPSTLSFFFIVWSLMESVGTKR